MQVRNEVEEAVTAEVGRCRREGASDPLACWCPLCVADVSALAMTILPPSYTTAAVVLARGPGKEGSSSVRSAVFTSLKRVARRPKHTRSSPETRPASVRLVNFTYEEAAAVVSSLARRPESRCTCTACLSDTLAYALNRYPSKYGVMHKGRESLPSYQREFMRQELQVIVSHAAAVVASRPRHSDGGGP